MTYLRVILCRDRGGQQGKDGGMVPSRVVLPTCRLGFRSSDPSVSPWGGSLSFDEVGIHKVDQLGDILS